MNDSGKLLIIDNQMSISLWQDWSLGNDGGYNSVEDRKCNRLLKSILQILSIEIEKSHIVLMTKTSLYFDYLN